MLHRDIEEHVEAVRAAKLSELTLLHESILNDALSGPVEALLFEASDETWPTIRKIFRRETENAVSGYSAALAGFDMDEQTKDIMLSKLELCARAVVEETAKIHSSSALACMRRKSLKIFTRDSNSKLRDWTGKEDINAICKAARISSLKALSVLAAIRLDDEADNIENTLVLAFVEEDVPLVSRRWEQVPASRTLITPAQCTDLWTHFLSKNKGMETAAYNEHALEAESKAETKKFFAFYAISLSFSFVVIGVFVLFKYVLKKI